MQTAELQTNYYRESGKECVDEKGDFTDEYVQWLQDHITGKRTKDVSLNSIPTSSSDDLQFEPTDKEDVVVLKARNEKERDVYVRIWTEDQLKHFREVTKDVM